MSPGPQPRLFDPERPTPYRGPWQPFPDALADDPTLTSGDRLLYNAIRRHRWECPGAAPDLDRIAALWGHRRTSMYPALRRLIAAGHVHAERHPGSGRYTVLQPAAVIDRDYRDRAEAEVIKGRKSARARISKPPPDPGSEAPSARAGISNPPESARAGMRPGGSPPISLQRFEIPEPTLRSLAPREDPTGELAPALAPMATPATMPDLAPLSPEEEARLMAEAMGAGPRKTKAKLALLLRQKAREEQATPPSRLQEPAPTAAPAPVVREPVSTAPMAPPAAQGPSAIAPGVGTESLWHRLISKETRSDPERAKKAVHEVAARMVEFFEDKPLSYRGYVAVAREVLDNTLPLKPVIAAFRQAQKPGVYCAGACFMGVLNAIRPPKGPPQPTPEENRPPGFGLRPRPGGR